MKSLHISLDIVHSGCKPINFMLSLTHSLQVFLPLPLHFTPAMQLHISTGWHPIIHILTFQMHKPPQSATPHHICQPHIEYPKDCKNPLCFPSFHTSISPSYAPPSADNADFQPALPMFQFHYVSTLWTQTLGIYSNFTLGSIATSLSEIDWTRSLQASLPIELNITLQLSLEATTFFLNPPETLRTRMMCDQLLPCKLDIDVLQNPWPHRCTPESLIWPLITTWHTWHHMTLVLPAFTLRPFISMLLYHFPNFSSTNSFVSATRTRSST